MKQRMENLLQPVFGVCIPSRMIDEFNPKDWFICASKEAAQNLADTLNRTILWQDENTQDTEKIYQVEIVPADVIHEICYGYQVHKMQEYYSHKLADAIPSLAPFAPEPNHPITFEDVAMMASDVLKAMHDED